MNVHSGLRIAARWNDGHIVDVAIDNARPRAARALRGHPVTEACARVPALFNVCRTAQGVAAQLACAAAGAGDAVRAKPAIVAALVTEMIQEHLWRLLLDWPVATGSPPRRAEFVGFQRRLRAPLPDDGHAALAAEIAEWLRREWSNDAAVGLAGNHGSPPRAPDAVTLLSVFADLLDDDTATATAGEDGWLPRQAAARWATTLGGVPPPEYCAHPTLGGIARETGALERQRHAPPVAALLDRGLRVAASYCARVVDLLECVAGLAAQVPQGSHPGLDAAPLPGGGGIARVETARGTLLHAVRVDDGRIADYAIVAPTEWNLHPAGPIRRELQGRGFAGAGPARRHLERLVLALDPCVAFEVFLDGADTRY